MKVPVLSDIHDHHSNLLKALSQVKKRKAKVIIFYGDYCAPTTFKILAEFGLPVYAVFGNVDGAHYEVMKAIEKNDYQVEQKKDLLEIELEGKKIAACHKPEFAEGLAATGKYDAVFHGYTRQAYQKKIGKILLANPGEILVAKGKCTFGIYDTNPKNLKFLKSTISLID